MTAYGTDTNPPYYDHGPTDTHTVPAAPVANGFDPARYLTKIGASDYLEVKWRLVWLRSAFPEATIETELVSHSDQLAIFRARVTLPSGASATGYASETYDDFRDFLEKCETKAIGRALAALGFGTQFCADFDEGGGYADSPADRGTRAVGGGGGLPTATPKQLNFVQGLARELGIGDGALEQESEQRYGVGLTLLTRTNASDFIKTLQLRQNPVPDEVGSSVNPGFRG